MNMPSREVIDRIVEGLRERNSCTSYNLTYSIDYKCLATALNLAVVNEGMPDGDWIMEFYSSLENIVLTQSRRYAPETAMLKALRVVSGLPEQAANAGLTKNETDLLQRVITALMRIAKRRIPRSLVIDWCATQLLSAQKLEFSRSTHAEMMLRMSEFLSYRAQQMRFEERLARENEFGCLNYVLSPDAAAILLEDLKFNCLPLSDRPFGDLFAADERAGALSDIATVMSEVQFDFLEFRRSRNGNLKRMINILRRGAAWRAAGYELTLGHGAKHFYEGFILAKKSSDAVADVFRRVRGV